MSSGVFFFVFFPSLLHYIYVKSGSIAVIFLVFFIPLPSFALLSLPHLHISPPFIPPSLPVHALKCTHLLFLPHAAACFESSRASTSNKLAQASAILHLPHYHPPPPPWEGKKMRYRGRKTCWVLYIQGAAGPCCGAARKAEACESCD